MNKSDSERIAALLSGVGFEPTGEEGEADLILVNTCSVRQTAEDRVYGQVRGWNALKERRPNLIIGVTGCMPGRDRDGALRKKLPIVDLYFPIADLPQLPRWIGELRPELVNSADLAEDYLKIVPERKTARQAFVTIQTGCNKFCTYCVVPFARGLEKNRPVRDILDEVRGLAGRGCVEVTLLGQTVNSYRAPDPEHFSAENPFVKRSLAHARDDKGSDHFAALLWEVNQISGISRLHFTAPHPLHMTDEVIEAMKLPAHVNFIHLPVQCGDNEVLRRMNRRYTREQYLDVVRRIREKIPAIAIGTDIIVGFSGESAEQFEQTASLYKEVGFDISYTAQYSQRSGTAAWRAFKDDVPREEKKRRWQVLQELMEKIVYEKNQAYVGKTVSVLVERHEPPKVTDEILAMPGNIQKILASQPGTCFGNSRELKLVSFPGPKDLVGQLVSVKIFKAERWILSGERVSFPSFPRRG
jgi:tRNA-2-methylthio-N6-dimethylallyladenosine synthase